MTYNNTLLVIALITLNHTLMLSTVSLAEPVYVTSRKPSDIIAIMKFRELVILWITLVNFTALCIGGP